MVNLNEDKCDHKKFYDKIPDYEKYSNTFNKMGFLWSIVMKKDNIEYWVMTCMFLG